jgi:hypothetical protein
MAGLEDMTRGVTAPAAPIHDVVAVQVLDGRDDAGDVEARGGGREASCAAQVFEQLPAADVVHQHVQAVVVFERAIPASARHTESSHPRCCLYQTMLFNTDRSCVQPLNN